MPEIEDSRDFVGDVTIHRTYIKIKFKGAITLKSQMGLVDHLLDLKRINGIRKFIVDTRGCPLRYSMTERYDLGSYFAEKAGNELIVATIIDGAHLTGLVENVAHNRGATKLAIVTGEEEAMKWLEAD
jgi:hypothetical protein